MHTIYLSQNYVCKQNQKGQKAHIVRKVTNKDSAAQNSNE